MICKRWFQLFGFSKTHPKRDELRRGYILLGVAAGCADEPWHAMARASKVGDVTLKQRELMKNRDLTNKSGQLTRNEWKLYETTLWSLGESKHVKEPTCGHMTRYPVPEAQCNYFTCSRSQINRVGKSVLVSEALQFSQLTAITMKTPCHRDHASKYGWVSSVPYSHVVFTVCDCDSL